MSERWSDFRKDSRELSRKWARLPANEFPLLRLYEHLLLHASVVLRFVLDVADEVLE